MFTNEVASITATAWFSRIYFLVITESKPAVMELQDFYLAIICPSTPMEISKDRELSLELANLSDAANISRIKVDKKQTNVSEYIICLLSLWGREGGIDDQTETELLHGASYETLK